MHSLLIHIGYHKTGSTWLQRKLFRSADGPFSPLQSFGDSFNHRKKGPKSFGRFLVFSEDGDLLTPHETRTNQIHAALAKIETSPDKVSVISSERLSGNPHAAGFDAATIANRIKHAFPQSKILIVIREQQSMIISCYYQYLKRGGVHSLENYVQPKYDGAVPKFSRRYLRYHELIGHYIDLFSADQVLVLPYELFLEDGTEFVHRICEFSGVNAPESLPISKRINFRGKKERAVIHHLRILNAVRIRDSVNDYSVFAVPVLRALANGIQKIVARLCTESYAKHLADKTDIKVAELIGDFYCESNTETSRLIGVDLKRLYGYQ